MMNKINSITVHANGDLTINGDYGVKKGDDDCAYPYAEVTAYLADHPEALVPEPAPPAPTPEQLKEREIAEKLAYLASTDWYVVRFAETGVAIPAEVSAARSAARARIDELRTA